MEGGIAPYIEHFGSTHRLLDLGSVALGLAFLAHFERAGIDDQVHRGLGQVFRIQHDFALDGPRVHVVLMAGEAADAGLAQVGGGGAGAAVDHESARCDQQEQEHRRKIH